MGFSWWWVFHWSDVLFIWSPIIIWGFVLLCRQFAYLSRCDITVLEMSAPASCNTRIIWNGALGLLPGWIITGQPSWAWAWAVAWRTFLSLSVRGQEQPISPMTPHLILVPSAPQRISLVRTSVSWGRVRMKIVYRLWNLSTQSHHSMSFILLKMYSVSIQLVLVNENDVLLGKSQIEQVILNQRFKKILLWLCQWEIHGFRKLHGKNVI